MPKRKRPGTPDEDLWRLVTKLEAWSASKELGKDKVDLTIAISEISDANLLLSGRYPAIRSPTPRTARSLARKGADALKELSKDFGCLLLDTEELSGAGDIDAAIAMATQFVTSCPSVLFREMARARVFELSQRKRN